MRITRGWQDTITLGGISLPISKAMILTASVATNTYYETLRYRGAVYQVPTGKKLVIIAQKVTAVSAAICSAELGQADASCTNSSSAPSGYAKIEVGTANTVFSSSASIGATGEGACYFEFSAGKYPTLRGGNTPAGVFLGYLVDA